MSLPPPDSLPQPASPTAAGGTAEPPARLLVISDLHGNWEALDAVLDATAGEYDSVVCLGDIVGYGANPVECSLWARDRCRQLIRGNHDAATADPARLHDFNWLARQAVEWTRAQMHPDLLLWLSELPQGPCWFAGLRLAHGSPLDEDEYVVSVEQAQACLAVAAAAPPAAGDSAAPSGPPSSQPAVPPLTFIGHTHVQGGFSLRNVGHPPGAGAAGPAGAAAAPLARMEVLQPEFPESNRVRLDLPLQPGTRYLINPGSVGQPRDGDWRAGYVLYRIGGDRLTFGRTAYDLPAAQKKILAAGLPRHLADRLALGK